MVDARYDITGHLQRCVVVKLADALKL